MRNDRGDIYQAITRAAKDLETVAGQFGRGDDRSAANGIRYVARNLSQTYSRLGFARYEVLTANEMRVLRTAESIDGRRCASYVARALGLHPKKIVRALAGLERKGFILRSGRHSRLGIRLLRRSDVAEVGREPGRGGGEPTADSLAALDKAMGL